ncbi:MAG: hypothetical protein F4Y02_17410 [Chloroflexi bacterium]|nr:hypothetical protein [Chloroflexota bacterium]
MVSERSGCRPVHHRRRRAGLPAPPESRGAAVGGGGKPLQGDRRGQRRYARCGRNRDRRGRGRHREPRPAAAAGVQAARGKPLGRGRRGVRPRLAVGTV